MRTLATQVKLRRLVRTSSAAWTRFAGDPYGLSRVGSTVDRLLELSGEVRQAWQREAAAAPLDPPLERYVSATLRSAELAIAGLQQAGADIELLHEDFQAAVLPLEIFLRGLDAEPALQRSA
ncbi:MAG TPA: hypothetical protein VKE27_05455 [Candidatus Dormibacteraeota bacterium]|nr:hypothetical protein [Candidatus Dormibacteraeota bacterium]